MTEKEIDLTCFNTPPAAPLDAFGGSSGRETLGACSRFLTRNGRACFPVMGEFHFSRYLAEGWEEELLKMKAGGVDIVSTYIFWNHHEEAQGCFDWSGGKNLRRFIVLCGRHGLYTFLRIGPWSHGECRNGGFPDWLVSMGVPLRQNSEPYLIHVRRFYREIARQAKGLLFSDGGPVVGVQLENEYGHCGGLRGEKGAAHMRTLRRIAEEEGLRVPFRTATGWGGGVVPEGDTLPVQGGYAEAPWEQHTHERPAEAAYLFRPAGGGTDIGSDFVSGNEEYSYDAEKYPYLTAELGGGLEPTRHRRPIVSADDTGALAMAALGSGAVMLGYYMYHGGTNPVGHFSTLQESKSSGGWNDVPELSYDFQAPVGEYGHLHGSYGRLKALHLFLHDFGEEMAEAACFLPPDNPRDAEDTLRLRYSVRVSDKGGFLFLSNYQRRREMAEQRDVSVTIRRKGECFRFEHIRLADGDYRFYPFGLNLGGLHLVCAQAQPLCRLNLPHGPCFVFFAEESDAARYCFRADGVCSVDRPRAALSGGIYELAVDPADFGRPIAVTLDSGSTVRLLTIRRKDAYRAWKARSTDGDHLLLTDAGLYSAGGKLVFTSEQPEIRLASYPSLPRTVLAENAALRWLDGDESSFHRYALSYRLPERTPRVNRSAVRNNSGVLSFEFSVEQSKGPDIADDFLTIRFSGDRARLLIDGKPAADWFWNGEDWRVGLKRFGNLSRKPLCLEVFPLCEDEPVFLEKTPDYHDGTACSVSEVSVSPVFRTHLAWNVSL